MNQKLVTILLLVLTASSCGTLKHSDKRKLSEIEYEERYSSRRKVLYPENTSPDEYVDNSGTGVNSAYTSPYERTQMTFTETEMNHVRVRGVNPLPENGLTISLDNLRNEFCYPYDGRFISDYGMRGQSFHTGVDIKAIPDDTIRAAFPGIVRMSKLYSSYGNIVVIRHFAGFETVYSHGSRNLVKPYDVVEAGTPIALAGRTGRATTEHLHFEVRVGGEHFDPKLMLDCENRELRTGTIYVNNINGTILASRSEDGLMLAAQAAEARNADENAQYAQAVAQSENYSSSQQAQSSQSSKQYHSVKQGDTLYGIARRYSTTVKKLCQLNGISESSVLQINQRLRVK